MRSSRPERDGSASTRNAAFGWPGRGRSSPPMPPIPPWAEGSARGGRGYGGWRWWFPSGWSRRSSAAMRKAHSYEEPAFDVYPLKPDSGGGEGRIGELAAPMKLGNWLNG